MILIAVPKSVLRAANSEVRKAGSLRMNWVLAGSVVGFTILAFAVLGMAVDHLPVEDGHKSKVIGAMAGPGLGVIAATVIAVLAAAVFGAFAAGSEYQYRSLPIGALFTTDRNLLFGAKLGVVAGLSLVVILLTELLGATALLVFGRDRVQFGVWLPAILGGIVLVVTCWSVIGAALGMVLRSSVQALAVMAGVAVLEPLIWVTSRAIGAGGVATILPISATIGAITNGEFADGDFIAPTPAAIVVLLLWTAAAGGAAWWFTTSRDL